MNPAQSAELALEHVRRLSIHYSCRVEVSSDAIGALGKLCWTCSDPSRDNQGCGATVEEAYGRYAAAVAQGERFAKVAEREK